MIYMSQYTVGKNIRPIPRGKGKSRSIFACLIGFGAAVNHFKQNAVRGFKHDLVIGLVGFGIKFGTVARGLKEGFNAVGF